MRYRVVVRGMRYLCIAIILFITAPRAHAQVGTQMDAHRAEQLAELMGKLSYIRVNLSLRNARAQDALDMLHVVIGVTIKGRYTTVHKGATVIGINPDAPITISFDDISALDALEMILDQAVEFEPVTWQLRNGFIEVGTKNRLMNHSERRIYPVRDLLHEAPDSQASGMRMFGIAGGARALAPSTPNTRPTQSNSPFTAGRRRAG